MIYVKELDQKGGEKVLDIKHHWSSTRIMLASGVGYNQIFINYVENK